MTSASKRIDAFFSSCGVTLDGHAEYDIAIRDSRFYDAVMRKGALGLGESYVAGWWDCAALDQLFERLAHAPKPASRSVGKYLTRARYALTNMQSRWRSHEVVDAHYGLDSSMFEHMLGPSMQYSCGYWHGAHDLTRAQHNKMQLVCNKLQLEPGDHVLDIGGGWGTLAKFIAENYGCRVTSLNISASQIAYGKKACCGLPVTFVAQDYRDMRGSFDKIVSVGMFEHVGRKNHRAYMEMAYRCLREDGLFLLHTVGENTTRLHADRWIIRYIFPHGYVPSASQVTGASEGLFVTEDWQNIGPHYDPTLMAWHENFTKSYAAISKLDSRFDADFYRAWTYYLLNCAGTFRARRLNVWQIVMTRHQSGTRWDDPQRGILQGPSALDDGAAMRESLQRRSA